MMDINVAHHSSHLGEKFVLRMMLSDLSLQERLKFVVGVQSQNKKR